MANPDVKLCRNLSFDERLFSFRTQVHIRFKECGSPGSLSCTCGFAVWEKTEFAIVDYCKTDANNPNQAPRLEAKIYSASKHKSGAKIIKKPGKSNAVTVSSAFTTLYIY